VKSTPAPDASALISKATGLEEVEAAAILTSLEEAAVLCACWSLNDLRLLGKVRLRLPSTGCNAAEGGED
jgi:hypothetical protein